jgi:hypothetical protein
MVAVAAAVVVSRKFMAAAGCASNLITSFGTPCQLPMGNNEDEHACDYQ